MRQPQKESVIRPINLGDVFISPIAVNEYLWVVDLSEPIRCLRLEKNTWIIRGLTKVKEENLRQYQRKDMTMLKIVEHKGI